jgi:gamma-D-glutamyl-L-lysine dipeptidyl-peptidase
MKYFGILILLALLVGCGVSDRKKTEEIIARFEQNVIPDKRESVFNVEPAFHKGKVVLKGETDDRELKRQLLDSLATVEVIDEITILPDSTVGEELFALVNLSAANLRAHPEHSSELVTQALLGTPVKVLKRISGWYLVQTPDRYIAWTDAAGIIPMTENELREWKNSDRILYSGAFTLVFENLDLKQPMADVTMGGILMLQETRWNLHKVIFPDGREGYTRTQDWVSFSEFLSTARPDSTSVVNMAMSLKGRPYLWGGTSSAAMDCSGFTRMIYFMHGVILPRDASLQAKNGPAVGVSPSYNNLQPGDLLFFGQKKDENQPEKITHVAISTGKTEYIHAAGVVQQNSFNPESNIYSEYRDKTFIKAVKIPSNEGTTGIRWIKNHPWY